MSRDRIGWTEVEYYARQRAWERTGYKDFNEARKAAQKLDTEKKLALLCEVFEEEIAQKYFEKKVKFQYELGKKMVVTKEEMLEWTKETFPNYEVVDHFYEDIYINPETRECERAPSKLRR